MDNGNQMYLLFFTGIPWPSQTREFIWPTNKVEGMTSLQVPELMVLLWEHMVYNILSSCPYNIFQKSKKNSQTSCCSLSSIWFHCGKSRLCSKGKANCFQHLTLLETSLINNQLFKQLTMRKTKYKFLPSPQICNTLNSDSLLKIKRQFKY